LQTRVALHCSPLRPARADLVAAVDGLSFDAGGGVGTVCHLSQPDNYDEDRNRYLLRSYGMGIRLNLFGFALIRWDYSIPLDRPNRKGYWMWTLGQSF
jgi:hypothetical protein